MEPDIRQLRRPFPPSMPIAVDNSRHPDDGVVRARGRWELRSDRSLHLRMRQIRDYYTDRLRAAGIEGTSFTLVYLQRPASRAVTVNILLHYPKEDS